MFMKKKYNDEFIKILDILKEKGITQKAIGLELDVNPSKLASIKFGRSSADYELLQKLRIYKDAVLDIKITPVASIRAPYVEHTQSSLENEILLHKEMIEQLKLRISDLKDNVDTMKAHIDLLTEENDRLKNIIENI